MAIGTATAVLAGSIGSAAIGSIASRRAARAQSRATDRAISAQDQQFERILELTQPQREIGNQAMNAIAQLLGLPGSSQGPRTSNVIRDAFSGDGPRSNLIAEMLNRTGSSVDDPISTGQGGTFNAAAALQGIPGNEVIVDDMMRRIQQASPTTGGNVLTALADRVGAFQSNRLFDSLFRLAGFGPSATGAAVAGAGNTGNAISQLLQSSGIANASGILGQGQAINSGLQNILQFFALKDILGTEAA